MQLLELPTIRCPCIELMMVLCLWLLSKSVASYNWHLVNTHQFVILVSLCAFRWQRRQRLPRLSKQLQVLRRPLILNCLLSTRYRTHGHCGTSRTTNATTGSIIRKSSQHSAQSRIFGRKWAMCLNGIIGLTINSHYALFYDSVRAVANSSLSYLTE